VKALRAAGEDELVASSLRGSTRCLPKASRPIEIKSGLRLDLRTRRNRCAPHAGWARSRSRCAPASSRARPAAGGGGRQAAYIDLVANVMLPAIAGEGLADAVDGFCEGIAFSPEQIARVFDAAKAAGLPVKLHADQLSNLHGAELAASYGALSADHLEYADEAGAIAMAKAGTVAVILPGAFYFIRETKKPPVDLFRRHGVRMALATDNNPGTSPLTSLLLTMNMAATLFGMT